MYEAGFLELAVNLTHNHYIYYCGQESEEEIE